MDPVRLRAASEVEAALLADNLVPPDPPSNLRDGATLDLREAMARFSPPATHRHRRALVVEAIASLDAFSFAAESCRRTTATLAVERDGAGEVDAMERLATVVPVEALAVALGVLEPDLVDVRTDVRAVVEVIGRQSPSSRDSDRAASRLLQRFGGDTPESAAAVSLLYQTHDATAALFASHLVARHGNHLRRPAIASTIRVATQATIIGSTSIPRGAAVVVDLDSPGFEFGLGPRECPGRGIAERIVAGMLAAIDASGLELCDDDIEWRTDGRPATLPMSVGDERS